MNPDAVLFVGGMAKAIPDVIMSDMLPNSMPERKTCAQHDTTNYKIAKQCIQCGTKFADQFIHTNVTTTTDIAIQNPTDSSIDFPETSTVVVGVNEIMPGTEEHG